MFFHVTREIKIGNKVYTPCVQYKLTKELEATVTDLVAKGRAVVLNEAVMFYNGAPAYPKKKAPQKKVVKYAEPKTVEETPKKKTTKKGKK